MSTLARVPGSQAVNSPAPAQVPQRPAAPAVDLAELTRLRREAREAGLAEGRKEGLEQGRKLGLEQGRSEGFTAGFESGKVAMGEQATRLRALVGSFPQAVRTAEAQLAEAVTGLALDLARQVLSRTLDVQPQLLIPLVQGLLREEPALQGDPRLLLNPEDVALVSAALGNEIQAAGWSVRADESITRGGCIVQAGTGTYDASLETRWAKVAAALGADPALVR